MYDYSKLSSVPDDNKLAGIARLAAEAIRADAQVEALAAKLKEAEKDRDNYKQKLLPEAMAEVGLPDFSTEDGLRITTKQVVRCSMAEKENPDKLKALEWLEANGNAGIIKRKVAVLFNLDEQDKVAALVKYVEKTFESADVTINRSVHGGTLKSLLTKFYKDGVEFPESFFKASTFAEAVIDLPT